MVTGVFCQSAIESAQSDHEMIMQNIIANKEAHIRKVRSLFTNLDADDSGYISLKELEQNIDKKSVTTYFEALELDVHDAFLMGCLRLRGPARALDLAKMQHEQNWMSQQLGQFMGHVEVNLKKLETGIVKLCEVQMELSTMGSKVSLSNMLSPQVYPKAKEPKLPEVEEQHSQEASQGASEVDAIETCETPGHVTHVNAILPGLARAQDNVLVCESWPEQL